MLSENLNDSFSEKIVTKKSVPCGSDGRRSPDHTCAKYKLNQPEHITLGTDRIMHEFEAPGQGTLLVFNCAWCPPLWKPSLLPSLENNSVISCQGEERAFS